MIVKLKGTTARGIQNELMKARTNAGVASGMVFTLIVVCDLTDYEEVMEACVNAGREHPSRILVVTNGRSQTDRLDAEISYGSEIPGEIISLRFQGELTEHRSSVLLPLLLPDSNVVVWWPGSSPAHLAEDPIGRLAKRRITDAMGAAKPLQALEIRARNMTPGDTDLTWTRLTPWRALLTSALDQFPEEVSHVVVEADANNAAGMLLAAWLDDRLGCRVERRTSDGPGITKVTMTVTSGDISISRRDGKMASFSAPGTPSRTVALRRRDINTVITEELRRMDADDVLQAAMQRLISRCTDEGRAALGAPEKALKSSKGTQIE